MIARRPHAPETKLAISVRPRANRGENPIMDIGLTDLTEPDCGSYAHQVVHEIRGERA